MFILYFFISYIIYYIILRKILKKNIHYNKTPFKNIWTYKDKKRFLKVINTVHNFCKNSNITVLPMYNSLLGVYKYKDILPWHGCFDLIVEYTDFDFIKDNFKEVLHKDKIDLVHTQYQIKIFKQNKTWPYISITKFKINDNFILLKCVKEYIFNYSDFFPVKLYNLDDILINIPNNTENVLNILYDNWKTLCTSSKYDHREQKIYHKTFSIKWEELYKQKNITFENTWVINLDRCKNRWNLTKNRLQNLGIIAKRWEATDKNSEEIKIIHKNINKLNFAMNTGVIACYLSHKRLWEYLYNIEVPYAIIFEDDIIFEENITLKVINKIFKNSIGFNIIFLGYTCQNRPLFTNQYVTEGGGTCLHAYIISRKGLKNLLDLNHTFSHPVDKVVKDFAEDNLCYISMNNNSKNFGHGIIQQDININSDLRVRFNIFGNIISL